MRFDEKRVTVRRAYHAGGGRDVNIRRTIIYRQHHNKSLHTSTNKTVHWDFLIFKG